MLIDLEAIEPFADGPQRAAAQTILALASIEGDQLEDPLEVRVTDAPMDDRGRVGIHGQTVDVADALRAGATVMATALSLLPAPTATQLVRVVGVLVAWSEVQEARRHGD